MDFSAPRPSSASSKTKAKLNVSSSSSTRGDTGRGSQLVETAEYKLLQRPSPHGEHTSSGILIRGSGRQDWLANGWQETPAESRGAMEKESRCAAGK